MRKTVSAILALIMILSIFSSCGGESVTDITSDDITEETTLSPTVRVTFPEGLTISEIAKRLEENDVCPAADFLLAANDTTLVTDYGFGASITGTANRAFLFEGYVFPDTYDFYRGENAVTALRRFLSNADSKINDEHRARAKELGYTTDEIMTIASIIQEESTLAEMAKVSSVLHNRLKAGMKLQCDVTIAYIENSVKPYIEGDINRYSEYYNTYKCSALPQGPICNPGVSAIEAALYPEDTDYLFFVTDKTTPSVFYYASTYEKHLANCKTAGWQ